MNTNTGELAELSTELLKELKAKGPDEYVPRSMFPNSPSTKRKDVVEVTIGDIVDVKGCPGKITHINPGKRRITLTMIGKLGQESEEEDDAPSSEG